MSDKKSSNGKKSRKKKVQIENRYKIVGKFMAKLKKSIGLDFYGKQK